jgi:hypothetical protein
MDSISGQTSPDTSLTCNDTDGADPTAAARQPEAAPQPPPPEGNLVVAGTIQASTSGSVQALVTADLAMLGQRRGEGINASPENQWATYDSLLAKYNDDLDAYNQANAPWKTYDQQCAAIDAANADVPAQNAQIDQQITSTGNELAALTTLNNLLYSGNSVAFDKAITTGELLDMAHASEGVWPMCLSQAEIDAAKYFEAHMDQWNDLSGNGTLGQGNAASGISQLTQLYNDLPNQKKKVQPHPAPPPGARPTPPHKPQQPHVPRPGSSASSSGGSSSTSGAGSTTDGTKDSSSTSGSKDSSSSGSKDATDATDSAGGGPKISQKYKSGAGGLEGAVTHAQDRVDQIQDRLAWIEDEIGRLETKSPQTAEDKDKLSKLRTEKLRLTTALQSASAAVTEMMTLISNLMKMNEDMLKAIIANIR